MREPNPFIDLKEKSFWQKSDTPIWIASSFFLQRNLSSHPFPMKMSAVESEGTLAALKQSIMNAKQLEIPIFYEMSELKPWEREYLLEHFFATCETNNAECKAGVIVDQSGSFLAMINGEDHLVLHTISSKSDWKEAWKHLSEIEAELDKNHSFAYSPKFGYLTSELANSGTALTVQAFLHLPSLIHLDQMTHVLIKVLENEVQVSGLTGERDFIGDILIIQNRFSIGLTEGQILEEVHKSATKLMNLEKTLRNELIEKPDALLVDKVSRAIGLLRHSYQIDIKEALAALSFIKLGIDLKWISGLTDKEINMTFFGVRRAHLALFSSGEILSDQLPQKRAEFLQEALKPITMRL